MQNLISFSAQIKSYQSTTQKYISIFIRIKIHLYLYNLIDQIIKVNREKFEM